MTRKHFEALALALKSCKPVEIIYGGPMDTKLMRNAYINSVSQWRADVRAIAATCVTQNARFDTHFYAACGYETQEANSADLGESPDALEIHEREADKC